MKKLSQDILNSFKSGLKRLTGYERRQYAAELTIKYLDGSPYKAERYLGVSRKMVEKGLKETATGIRCMENFHLRGRKKKKKNTKV